MTKAEQTFDLPPGWVQAWQTHPVCPQCGSSGLEAQTPDGRQTAAIMFTDFECIDCEAEITHIHNLTVNFTVKSDDGLLTEDEIVAEASST